LKKSRDSLNLYKKPAGNTRSTIAHYRCATDKLTL